MAITKGCAGAIMDVPSFCSKTALIDSRPSGELHTFQDKTAIGRHAVRSQNFEKPSGEWNTLTYTVCAGHRNAYSEWSRGHDLISFQTY